MSAAEVDWWQVARDIVAGRSAGTPLATRPGVCPEASTRYCPDCDFEGSERDLDGHRGYMALIADPDHRPCMECGGSGEVADPFCGGELHPCWACQPYPCDGDCPNGCAHP